EELIFGNVSYLKPYAFYTYDPSPNAVTKTALALASPVNYDDMEVEREFAVSRDGTKVPLNIIRKKGIKLDGKNPTLLTGYGGYGGSMSPYFDLGDRGWVDQGGVYVMGNLRGGGEFGEAWRKAGKLAKKQNGFDDCIACGQGLS